MAGEYARMALALEELPHIAAAFDETVIGWEQVREVAKVATPETD